MRKRKNVAKWIDSCAHPLGIRRRGMKKPPPTSRNEPTYYQVGALIVLSSVLNNEGYLYQKRLCGLPRKTRRFTQLLRGGRITFILGRTVCNTSLDLKKSLADDVR